MKASSIAQMGAALKADILDGVKQLLNEHLGQNGPVPSTLISQVLQAKNIDTLYYLVNEGHGRLTLNVDGKYYFQIKDYPPHCYKRKDGRYEYKKSFAK